MEFVKIKIKFVRSDVFTAVKIQIEVVYSRVLNRTQVTGFV